MKTVVICAGGPIAEVMNLSEFDKENTIFIGADKGALHLFEQGIVPHEAVGDFDSVSKRDYEKIVHSVRIVDRFRAEKDETDTELAVERALVYQPETIILTGVTGGRLDHTQSALHLMYRYQTNHPEITFSIRNPLNELTMLTPGTYIINDNEQLPYISFFPFGQLVSGLTLEGFKFDVANADLQVGTTKYTSNELVEGVCTILFHEGICLMVRSSDA
ncbi:thiamine diphosphokinase [Sporosarcina siberiensis]|uniref:Thiamine diphosphokinase n=1 Tax=Sporosarcina siberiensis TaxID=1365606 RepID=A0ABW4SH05_9BACL